MLCFLFSHEWQMARKQYAVANWKMYKTAREASHYIEELAPLVAKTKVQVFLSVPFTSIATAAQTAKDTNIVIGAQNMSDARDGAFTGEIAALMLKEAGADFVILGHSERRHVFGESDAFIHRKVMRALQDDLVPILCVGETEKERKNGKMEEVLQRQIESAFHQIPKEAAEKVILAYEPVWAIGTGQTATPKQAQEAHAFCRAILSEIVGKRKADSMAILYGGSVKSANAGELAAEKDIDGVLVGGASLDPKTFAEIVLNTAKKTKAVEKEKPAKTSPKPRVKKEKKK